MYTEGILGLSEMARLVPTPNEVQADEMTRRKLRISPLKLDELGGQQLNIPEGGGGGGSLHLKKMDSSCSASTNSTSDHYEPLFGRKLIIRHT